ncbi:MAG: metalloregulator ArsR/SmtB family transcription factor [Anaerolineae bacterium]|nr:metalloregulator ArsR/SmtB family transcription factor [Anaerolineae bacterium]
MAIPSLDELDLLHSHICTAVGDPKRIQILYALYEQPRNVSALTEALATPQPTISRHLTVLRDRSIVVAKREGQSVVYSLSTPKIIEILDAMRQILRDSLDHKSNLLANEDSSEAITGETITV